MIDTKSELERAIQTSKRRSADEIALGRAESITTMSHYIGQRWIRSNIGRFNWRNESYRRLIANDRRRFIANQFSDIGGLIDSLARGFADEWTLDQSDIESRVWEKLSREYAKASQSWIERFWNESSYRNGVIGNLARDSRNDSYRASTRNSNQLRDWNRLVDAMDESELIAIQSSGASPADAYGNRSTVWVDGNALATRSMQASKRAIALTSSNQFIPERIDSSGANVDAMVFGYEARLFRYYGAERIEKTYQALSLIDSVLCATYRTSRSGSVKYRIRWESYGAKDKGTKANVRSLLSVPDSVSRDAIKNEFMRLAKIASGDSVRSRKRIESVPVWWNPDTTKQSATERYSGSNRDLGRPIVWTIEPMEWIDVCAWDCGNDPESDHECELRSKRIPFDADVNPVLPVPFCGHSAGECPVDCELRIARAERIARIDSVSLRYGAERARRLLGI